MGRKLVVAEELEAAMEDPQPLRPSQQLNNYGADITCNAIQQVHAGNGY